MDLVRSGQPLILGRSLSIRRLHIRHCGPTMGRDYRGLLPYRGHDHLLYSAFHEHLYLRDGLFWRRSWYQRAYCSCSHFGACTNQPTWKVRCSAYLHHHSILPVGLVGTADCLPIAVCLALDWTLVWPLGLYWTCSDSSLLPPTPKSQQFGNEPQADPGGD